MTWRRWGALGGVAGPIAFVAAWSTLGATRPGYSAVADPISRLAAIDTSTRLGMSCGFLAFAGGVAAFAPALHGALPGGAAAAAATNVVATLGVAALPIGSSLGGWPHAAAAGLGYASLAAMPLLAARPLRRIGHPRVAMASTIAGVVIGTALLVSTLGTDVTGLAQRVGLTLGDAWIVATAVAILRGRLPQ